MPQYFLVQFIFYIFTGYGNFKIRPWPTDENPLSSATVVFAKGISIV